MVAGDTWWRVGGAGGEEVVVEVVVEVMVLLLVMLSGTLKGCVLWVEEVMVAQHARGVAGALLRWTLFST